MPWSAHARQSCPQLYSNTILIPLGDKTEPVCLLSQPRPKDCLVESTQLPSAESHRAAMEIEIAAAADKGLSLSSAAPESFVHSRYEHILARREGIKRTQRVN